MHDETKLDLTEEQLRERFITPYERGEPIIINGKTIQASDVERIRITRSAEDSRRLIAEAKAREAASSVAFIGGPSFEWIAAGIADDVTDAIITGPPGYRRAETNPQQQPESSQVKLGQSSELGSEGNAGRKVVKIGPNRGLDRRARHAECEQRAKYQTRLAITTQIVLV